MEAKVKESRASIINIIWETGWQCWENWSNRELQLWQEQRRIFQASLLTGSPTTEAKACTKIRRKGSIGWMRCHHQARTWAAPHRNNEAASNWSSKWLEPQNGESALRFSEMLVVLHYYYYYTTHDRYKYKYKLLSNYLVDLIESTSFIIPFIAQTQTWSNHHKSRNQIQQV